MTFGEKLKAARKRKKLTQKQLASLIHAAHSSISDWEHDQHKPDPDTIQNLCWALEVTPNYFFLPSHSAMTTGSRIKLRRKEIGVPVEDIAAALNVSVATVYRYESGDIEKVPGSVLEPLSKILHTTPAWLMGWESNDSPQTTKQGQKENERLPLPANAYELEPSDLIPFKVIGTIAAGYGSEAIEEYTGDIQIVPRASLRGRRPEEFFVLRVKGNSMYPQFLEGDHVLILRCDVVTNGSVAVVLYDGNDATLKKVQYGDGYMDLIPINPEYQAKHITGSDLSNCRILGRAMSLMRDFEL